METKKTQEMAMPQAEPQKEHRWLEKLVGDWTFESDACVEPGKTPEKFKGLERVRSLGGLWMVADGQGEMPGSGASTTMLTLGYDPQKKKFVGTWIGSMMTHLWIYEGTLDAGGRTLTLETEGPDMSGDGRTALYRDVLEWRSDDHRTLTSHMQGQDGQWRTFMTAHYRRRRVTPANE